MNNLKLAFLVEPGPTLRRYIKEGKDFVPGVKVVDILADVARIYSANYPGWCLRFADDHIPHGSERYELSVPTGYNGSDLKLRTIAIKNKDMSDELTRAHKAYSDFFNPPETDPVPEMIAMGVPVASKHMPLFRTEEERYEYAGRVQRYDPRLTFNDALARLPAPQIRCPITEASPGYRVLDTK